MAGELNLPIQSPVNRFPCVLLLDTSNSMNPDPKHPDSEHPGGKIGELNRQLPMWEAEIKTMPDLQAVGEIAVITFGLGGVQVVDPTGTQSTPPANPFAPILDFNPQKLNLRAGGVTPMVEAIQRALEVLTRRKNEIRAGNMTLAHRPIIYLVSDGEPTDANGNRNEEWRKLCPVLREHERGKHVLFFALGVQGADFELLRSLAPESTYEFEGKSFGSLLKFVSTSMERALAPETNEETASEFYGGVRQEMTKNDRIKQWLNDQQ